MSKPNFDAAKARGRAYQAEQARIQSERNRRDQADRAATDAAAAAQQASLPNLGEQVRRQRLGVVVAPATVGRAASVHTSHITAAVSAAPAWRKFRADLAELEPRVRALEAARGIRA